MRIKILALISGFLFVASYVYFLHIGGTVYDLEMEVNYFEDTVTVMVVPVGLALVLALVIWLFTRRSYERYFYLSLTVFFIAGIVVDLFATYLMIWSSGQNS